MSHGEPVKSHGKPVKSHGEPVKSHGEPVKVHGQEEGSAFFSDLQSDSGSSERPPNGIRKQPSLLMKDGKLLVRDGKLLVWTVISVVREGKDVATLPKELANRVHSLKRRVHAPAVLENLVYDLCEWFPLTRDEIGQLIGRRDQYVRKLLSTMVGKYLDYTIPDMVRHPNQAYKSIPGRRPNKSD